ncbi:hypothetical protein [uncultured Thomasclavelia sp.]|uniref:hypothetical protein n=1 Tax=uncultured Thomasclavelia sp. TaxID=3025759 RepID=UPI00261CF58B|nr:hypothetical protein [uncultured Thomasclavelia sp.]
MVSEAKKRANMKSDKKNAKYVTLKLNKNTDKDILEYLDTLDNKNGYLKNLIRQDIKNKK